MRRGRKEAGCIIWLPATSRPGKPGRTSWKKLPWPGESGRFGRYAGFFGFGGRPEVIPDRAGRRFLLNRDGDIALLAPETRRRRAASNRRSRSGARFHRDESGVAFIVGDNLFVLPLDGRGPRQLTSFTRETAARTPGEARRFGPMVEDQQKELFTQFQQSGEASSGGGRAADSPARRPGAASPPASPVFCPRTDRSVFGLELSADERHVVFLLSESDPGERSTVVPDYVDPLGFTETIPSRTKAGYPPPEPGGGDGHGQGEVKWVDFGRGERELRRNRIFVSPDRKTFLLQVQSADRKDVWLFPPESRDGLEAAAVDPFTTTPGSASSPDRRLFLAGTENSSPISPKKTATPTFIRPLSTDHRPPP
jgi:hypothetical protein